MKLVILDRDGVINQDSDAYIKSPDEFIPIPGSLEAIARLNHAGYTVAVATNQSGIARGYFDLNTLNQMHAKLQRLLAAVGGRIDLLLFCPHGPEAECHCRKPKPGMLEEVGRRLDQPLQGVPVVGDSLRDLEAAQAVGAWPLLVRTGKGERTLGKPLELTGVSICRDLNAAVDLILAQEG